MGIKQLREAVCDKCKKVFYRKLVPNREKGKERQLTQINEVGYWTEGKSWGEYKILCRGCLNEWFEKYRIDFTDLVEQKKQKLFYHYRYQGLLNKERELYRN